jgi:hypothetical protein
MVIFAGHGIFPAYTRAPHLDRCATVPGHFAPAAAEWKIDGVLAVPNPWGAPMTSPLFLQRMHWA